jgi:hypothetical protein
MHCGALRISSSLSAKNVLVMRLLAELAFRAEASTNNTSSLILVKLVVAEGLLVLVAWFLFGIRLLIFSHLHAPLIRSCEFRLSVCNPF